jgi:dTDP-4-amino-4,6-dideoxy-D-galactose acyltransferase
VEIRRLDWDSQFLGLEVFGINLSSIEGAVDIGGVIRSLRDAGAGLAYFFLKDNDLLVHNQLTESGAVLYDQKVTYGKELMPDAAKVPQEVEIYQGDVTDELLKLAYLAGHESRFRKDPRLLPYFKTLYELWMTNSLNGAIADRVFIYRLGNSIKGMVTCKILADKVGSIGLIATDAGCQGRGLGTGLVKATEDYYEGKVTTSTVVTQKTNIQACAFYEKAGFREYKTEYVYHLWFN